MSKRITITKHDIDLIEWLVNYYMVKGLTSENIFPALQNLNELLEKLNEPPTPKQ